MGISVPATWWGWASHASYLVGLGRAGRALHRDVGSPCPPLVLSSWKLIMWFLLNKLELAISPTLGWLFCSAPYEPTQLADGHQILGATGIASYVTWSV